MSVTDGRQRFLDRHPTRQPPEPGETRRQAERRRTSADLAAARRRAVERARKSRHFKAPGDGDDAA